MKKEPSGSWLCAPLGVVYSSLAGLRTQLYSQGLLKSSQLSVPVVSVGNLTVGGTGKTPLVAQLLHWAQERGLRVGVVSRGYGSRFEGTQRVRPGDPPLFGDEPQMLANQFPEVPVYVDPKRVRAAEVLLRDQQVDLILADDGFQHLKLKRSLDIVVIDALEPSWHYRPLPWGRARESLAGLSRASYLVLTKVNFVSEEDRQRLRLSLHSWAPSVPVVVAELAFSHFSDLNSGEDLDLSGQSLVAVSGIGRPEGFKKLLEGQKIKVLEHLVFADHHNYGLRDLKKIATRIQASGAKGVVVTAKDAVKLKAMETDFPLYVAHVELKFLEGVERIYEDLSRLAGQSS